MAVGKTFSKVIAQDFRNVVSDDKGSAVVAGRSYFDADIRFSDGGTGQSLGMVRADKNSWALGGSLAVGQTVETFMREAAKTTAADAAPLPR